MTYRMTPTLTFVALTLGFALWSAAADAQVVDCLETSVQSEMTQCAKEEWQDADADLNEAYLSAMDILKTIDADLDPSQQGAAKSLKEAQRAWITFRDQACKAEGYLYFGGSMRPMVMFGCKAALTRARAVELWAMTDR